MGLLNSNSLNEWAMGIPDRAREMYAGLLDAPRQVGEMFTPQFAAKSREAYMKSPYIIDSVMSPKGLLNMDKQKALATALEATGMAPMGIAGHIVYHGSPHKFDKFDMSKIGTGEGAQAYGHGLYFSENPAVAKTYHDSLAASEYKIKGGGEYNPSNPLHMAAAELDAATQNGMNKYQLAEDLRRQELNLRARDTEWAALEADKKNSVWQALFNKDLPELESISHGAFYKVDIPDESIPRMLDWDKPLSEQADSIKPILRNLLNHAYGDGAAFNASGIGETAKDYLMNQSGANAADIIKNLSRRYGDDAASKMLKQQGIPGIRYLDGMSRGAGEGSSNYVLFDDALARILEINGQPTGLLPWGK